MTMTRKISKTEVALAGATGICAGANIRTPIGERRVEFLRKGDLVVTRDNGLQPVLYIWTRTVQENEIAADPSLAPVALGPRAIGPMMPQKTLRVGGAHRLLVPGWRLADEDDTTNCLIPARDVDGVSLGSDAPVEEVTYYNIVFASPQVFAANGLPLESFSLAPDVLSSTPKDVQEDIGKLLPKADDDPETSTAPVYKRRQRASYTPSFA